MTAARGRAALQSRRSRQAEPRSCSPARGGRGVRAEALVDERGPVAKVLLERAEEHGLLALGAPAMSRHAHLLVGGVATQAAHPLPAS
jgi:hypothetical protein